MDSFIIKKNKAIFTFKVIIHCKNVKECVENYLNIKKSILKIFDFRFNA